MPFTIHSVQVVLLVASAFLICLGVVLSLRRRRSIDMHLPFKVVNITPLDERVCMTCGTWVAYSMDCFHCGRPVHLQEPGCGSWIPDVWHDSAFDEVNSYEFWCRACLKEVNERKES